MTHVLAAEGGYQAFHLHGGEWFWLIFAAFTALLAIGVGIGLRQTVLAEDEGTPKMIEIAKAIEEGALAYLRRQFRTIGIILVPLAILVFLTATKVVRPDGSVALSYVQSGLFRTIAFVLGCFMSGLTGFIGMSLAVKGNVRTAAAAKRGSLPAALKVAFRTGGVAGMFTVGLGLIGATLIIIVFQNTSSAILIGFGFGGSLLALFLRVGGGIFTKAADVGADLVGKVEAGIPEDDPRNAATIADNVGDNVGDCAGMAADLFESYEVTLVASIILGVAAFHSIGANPALGLIFPVIARALGVLCSIVGVFSVKATDKDKSAMAPINRGFLAAGILTVVTTFFVAIFYVGNKHGNEGWKVFGAVTAGLVLAQMLSRLTEYFTSTERQPVRDIAEATRTGPATVVLSGIASGLESSVYAIILIAVTIGAAVAISGGNIEFALYLVALAGMGMLATTGVVVSEDTFGPVSDNAAGIAEMSGEFEGEPARIMVSLDAVGNTTKAVTKGFAIGSAVIAAVALFSSFVETIGDQVPSLRALGLTGSKLFQTVQVNVADPKTFIGLMIGGSVAFMFSALAIRAVGRTAGTVVQEVRRQFREHPGIMDYTEKPEYGRVIDICTTAALRELATPALIAVLTPVIIGFGINYLALGAFLAAVIVVGQLMANFLSNSGGAWDNAKKYIEDGHEGGKGSESHKAAVIGDTVGDPFKDTAGPALNPLIKVMNLVSLLILPAIISLGRGPLRTKSSGAGYAIAGAALVVLIVAIAYSKRKVSAMDTELPTSTPSVGPMVAAPAPAMADGPYAPSGLGAGAGATDAFGAQWTAPAPVPGTAYQPNAPAAPPWEAPAPQPWEAPAAAPLPPAPVPTRGTVAMGSGAVAPAADAFAPAPGGYTPPGPPTEPPAPQMEPPAPQMESPAAPEVSPPPAVMPAATAPAPAPAPTPAPTPAPAPAFITPTDQAHVDTNQPFAWVAVPGASEYCLTIGSAQGADDLVNSGPLGSQQTSFPVPSLPAGRSLWARIYTSVDGRWSHADVSFSAAPNEAAFIWPGNGQNDVGSDRPFTWSRVPWATNYWLTVGSTPGGSDVLNTGPLPAGQSSFAAIPPLPPGVPLHARLLTHDGANWTFVDVTFSAR
jgi:K(+)-stimulated pyrophosphate-energized sodium pump